VALFLLGRPWWAVPFVLLAAFFAFFFRDPDRHTPGGSNLVISPADGKVMLAGPAVNSPPGEWQQITIFLSPMDVHINRVPIGGRVTRIERLRGTFLPAYRAESAENERTEVWVEHNGQVVVFRQVVGVLARRVVCRLTPGQTVRTGERFGLMKFGSRMDVFVPPAARLRVRAGTYVRGGETVLAEL
jgi:phosphatidylserine decarboxylase